MCTREEVCHELLVFEGALDDGDIFEGFELLAYGRGPLSDMGFDLVAGRLLV